MDKLYLIVCGLIALFLPHLTHESVSTVAQVLLQFGFIGIGWFGFKTFSE